jgi:2-dehydro-3-deoxyphosphogluconate aldolase/(4S)-4-hydroxy-2-oxoglutarate aldolase
MKTVEQRLAEIKVVPVIAIKDASKAAKLAEVLIDNGLPCAEVTFRTEQAEAAIRAMRNAHPDMLLGSGTVLTEEQVDRSISAGVDFVVSPGLNPKTVKYCQSKNIPIVPGVNNPSLVEQAMDLGLKTLKFFPAEPSGGVAMLKALTAVYPVTFMPTGGVSPKNVNDYLSISSVFACGGTWMVPADLIEDEKWDELGALVKQVSSILD